MVGTGQVGGGAGRIPEANTSHHNTVTIRHLGILTVPDMARVWPLLLASSLQLASCLELYQLEWQLVEGGQCGANMSYNR